MIVLKLYMLGDVQYKDGSPLLIRVRGDRTGIADDLQSLFHLVVVQADEQGGGTAPQESPGGCDLCDPEFHGGQGF